MTPHPRISPLFPPTPLPLPHPAASLSLTRRGAEAGAGTGAAPAGALLVHDELVDGVVLYEDGGLAVLHPDAQVVVLGLDLLHVLALDGEGVAAVPDHQVRLLFRRLFYGLLDQLFLHACDSSLCDGRLRTSRQIGRAHV